MADTNRDVTLTLKAKTDGSPSKETKKVADDLRKTKGAADDLGKQFDQVRGKLNQANESFSRTTVGAESLARGLIFLNSGDKGIEALTKNLSKLQGVMDVGRGFKDLTIGMIGLAGSTASWVQQLKAAAAAQAALGAAGAASAAGAAAAGSTAGKVATAGGAAAAGAGAAKAGGLGVLGSVGAVAGTAALGLGSGLGEQFAQDFWQSWLTGGKSAAQEYWEAHYGQGAKNIEKGERQQRTNVEVDQRKQAINDLRQPFQEAQKQLGRQKSSLLDQASGMTDMEAAKAEAERSKSESVKARGNLSSLRSGGGYISPADELKAIGAVKNAMQGRLQAEMGVLEAIKKQQQAQMGSLQIIHQAAQAEKLRQQNALAAAKAEKKSAAETFGAMSPLEKIQVNEARKRFEAGNETADDRNLLRGVGFGQKVDDRNRAAAESDPRFAEITKASGMDDREQAAKEGLARAEKMEVKIQEEIAITIKANEAEVAKQITEKIAPIFDRIIQAVKEQAETTEARMAAANRAAGS